MLGAAVDIPDQLLAIAQNPSVMSSSIVPSEVNVLRLQCIAVKALRYPGLRL
jgi:hypothetical protein